MGDFSIRMLTVLSRRGYTEIKIRIDITREHMGSVTYQPKNWIRRVDIITPTEPRVSASTCKNTPFRFSLWE